jgi:hypothetical protein
MTFTANTYALACELAATCRKLYAADGWHITIVRPLFKGDTYRVNVS